MRNLMDRMLERYGQPGTVFSGGRSVTVQVILQSVMSLNWQNMDYRHSSLGRLPRGQYICILPADTQAEEGGCLLINGKEYEFRRLEPMAVGEQIVYIWCLCVEKGA